MTSAAAPPRQGSHEPEYLTVPEAADAVNVTPRWIKRAYLDGRLAHVKFGTHVRIPRADLDRFIAENTREAR